jgi:hypothetical protein
MTIEELFSLNGRFIVHTGIKHLEEFVRSCEHHDVWWCGQKYNKVTSSNICNYARNLENSIGLSIMIEDFHKSFVFIKADFPGAIEYEDLISEQPIAFDNFDLFL